MNIDFPVIDDVPILKKLWMEAFGDTAEAVDVFFDTAFSAERCMCVKCDGNIAAALYWFDCTCHGNAVAYIYAVATSFAYRGRGICHKLMDCTHNYLKCNGYSGAVLVPGNDSLFDMYSNMGYAVCGRVSEFDTVASQNEIFVKELNKYDYAMLRRKYLPEGGVVQEGENIEYLASYSRFFSGEDFLLATSMENGKLRCAELLGNSYIAPDILYALGCCTGRFRVPGNGRAFAMYYTLDKKSAKPEYFGLAFD